jgi:DNA-binding response OmpR family regulator
MPATIHLVDDDQVLREFIAGYLSSVGFDVRSFDGVAAFREAATAGLPDIVISDLIMPGENGLALLSWLRGFSQVPVIMLTSQDATTDRVVGLELGADDYLAKPCEPRELLACVRTQLRRLKAVSVAPPAAAPVCWQFAGRSLDERSLELRVDGARVELPKKPLEVLLHFLRHAGEIVTKDQLLEAVWPGRIVSETSLTNAIGKLRTALGDEDQTLIKAVYGYGYRFEVKPERG